MWQNLKNYYHFAGAIIANISYGFPSKKLFIVGVTGTDGKTTTCSLIYHLLKTAGKKVAMVTTVGVYINDKVHDTGFHVTTPSPARLNCYIQKAVKERCEYLILETTSHALDQNRVWGVDYKIAVLTNITHEHLDYHKTYQNYLNAKLKLLQKTPICILNLDDGSYKDLQPQLKNHQLVTYSLANQAADLTYNKFPFQSNLTGKFNQQNALAAIAVAKQLNLPDKTIRQGLKSFMLPQGRQEVVYNGKFKVIVDFAHTPNAFAQILPEVKAATKGRLIHLFGAAGKRDTSKRPLMGKESDKLADVIILTAEDPRGESVLSINQQIASGFENIRAFIPEDSLSTGQQNFKTYFSVPDRKSAIQLAIKIAQAKDIVLLTGKGHEKSINYSGEEQPWDEKNTVKEALKISGVIH